jgi:DNA-binding NarL/FixJ family response regulator
MPIDTKGGCVVIVDSHHLRRESILAIVQPWSEARQLKLLSTDPKNITGLDSAGVGVELVILNVGGASLFDSDHAQSLKTIQETFPHSPCAVLSDNGDPYEAITACQKGCKAFVSSSLDPALVLKAFSFLINGGTYFPLDALLAGSRQSHGSDHHPSGISRMHETLTPRQAEVLDRLRSGKSNKVIARELQMQESTVKVHVRQIMRKLGATNRTQAALLAQADREKRPDEHDVETSLHAHLVSPLALQHTGFSHAGVFAPTFPHR